MSQHKIKIMIFNCHYKKFNNNHNNQKATLYAKVVQIQIKLNILKIKKKIKIFIYKKNKY